MSEHVQSSPSSPELASQRTLQIGSGGVATPLRPKDLPSREEILAEAERLLENGSIPSALKLYRRARIVPDTARLTSAAAAQRKLGRIYPEIYDFLIETLSW